MGKASGRREQTEEPLKSRRGFGYRVRQARARPSNTSVRDLLSNDRYTEVVLGFLRNTSVKAGATVNRRQDQGSHRTSVGDKTFLFPSFLSAVGFGAVIGLRL